MSQILFVGPRCPEIPPAFQNRTQWIDSPWGNRNSARNRGLQAATEAYVLACDDDIQLPSLIATHRALQILIADPKCSAVAGSYLDAEHATTWARAYNFHCNSWLRLRSGRFLAGLVLFRKDDFNWPEELIHGGEEEFLAQLLKLRGQKVVLQKNFQAVHDCQHDAEFLRQRLHGHEVTREAGKVQNRLMLSPTGIASMITAFVRLPPPVKSAALFIQWEKTKIRLQIKARDRQVFQNSEYSGNTLKN